MRKGELLAQSGGTHFHMRQAKNFCFLPAFALGKQKIFVCWLLLRWGAFKVCVRNIAANFNFEFSAKTRLLNYPRRNKLLNADEIKFFGNCNFLRT